MKINNTKTKQTLQKIHDFFEKPDSVFAYFVQIVIIFFIFLSVALTGIEFFAHPIYLKFADQFHILNLVILGVFTIEYVLRLISAPKKTEFIRKPMNVVDFLSIAPNYLEFILAFFIQTQEFRIIRLLRLSRLIRAFKIFEYRRLIEKVFVLKDTILEAMIPVMVMFASIKGIIWYLELHKLWFTTPDLSNLFATIGFALGIILSQKIGVSYDKFLNIDKTILTIYGNLESLKDILDYKKLDREKAIITNWAKVFLFLLEHQEVDNGPIHDANKRLYQAVAKIDSSPSSNLAILYADIVKDAAYVLSKKTRITPKAYDVLLHQVTILYLVLMAIFIPGAVGMASVLIATYLLYGMYELTEDLDSILGGKHNLININMTEIKSLTKVDK